MITFNKSIKLILSDVDETVADVYTPATTEMINELVSLLKDNIAIFFVTGASLERVEQRIIKQIPDNLRKKILVSHCSGAEVWGYEDNGERMDKPYYSLYEGSLTNEQKTKWREIVKQVIDEFNLKIFPATTVKEFKTAAGDDPLAIMLEDRGPQITFEVVNGYDLSPEQEKQLEISVPESHGALDLRIPILERFDILLQENNIPITPRLGGIFALDLGLKGVSKTDSVKHLLENDSVLKSIGLNKNDLQNPDTIEIWGDKFDQYRGGTDRHMHEAVNPKVRAIDFREENPDGFILGYNVVLWDGEKHLHEGLLEYLQNRHLIF